jgi:hypothetical protein
VRRAGKGEGRDKDLEGRALGREEVVVLLLEGFVAELRPVRGGAGGGGAGTSRRLYEV